MLKEDAPVRRPWGTFPGSDRRAILIMQLMQGSNDAAELAATVKSLLLQQSTRGVSGLHRATSGTPAQGILVVWAYFDLGQVVLTSVAQYDSAQIAFDFSMGLDGFKEPRRP